jgi:acetyl-CoA/propionyl-CoA carboxylase biotin carboxyl carrier protein
LVSAASKSILRKAGFVGAGTCEFLVAADGQIFFLEVNTRLQVEHPVTEEVTDIDLVREQFRIAEGQCLDYADPVARRHCFEFRINCEDPGRGFLPMPGTVAKFTPPAGPGVRVDSGVESGTVIGLSWDSLLAKLIVTGADRTQALQRATRALAEFAVGGIATTLPFHRAVVADPAFASETFNVHTRWIETDFVNTIAAHNAPADCDTSAATVERETVVAEVGGKRITISLPSTFAARARPATAARSRAVRNSVRKAAVSGAGVVIPMQGTIVKVAVTEGQVVVAGELIAVVEAMKMEQPLTAHKSGTVVNLRAEIGQTVASGTALCHIES